MYTIFKNDCVFYLTDLKDFSTGKNFFYWNEFDLNGSLEQCAEGEKKVFYLYHYDIEYLWKDFLGHFKRIEAAGGVVFNQDGEILFIFRNEKWDLPKGKIEKNEGIREAALREVMEECGIEKEPEIGEFITKTYHIYEYKGKEILKISHWFKMLSNEKNLKPQIEEDITRVVWMNKEQIHRVLKNTYGNIALLIEKLI